MAAGGSRVTARRPSWSGRAERGPLLGWEARCTAAEMKRCSRTALAPTSLHGRPDCKAPSPARTMVLGCAAHARLRAGACARRTFGASRGGGRAAPRAPSRSPSRAGCGGRPGGRIALAPGPGPTAPGPGPTALAAGASAGSCVRGIGPLLSAH